MGALRNAILRIVKEQPATKGFLARELARDRTTILKALRSLTRRGLIKKRKIQVRWLGDHVAETILFYTEESASMLPALRQGDVLDPEDPACLPCLSEAYHRQLYTKTIFENMRHQP